MKPVTLFLSAIVVLTIGACNLFKKSTPEATSKDPSRIAPSVRSSDGVFTPGNAELTALQKTHPEVTISSLLEGHKLYTGVCTNCHQPKSIYDRPIKAWPDILTTMAKEANITDAQKDAVYKYVLSIKATQPR